MRDRTNWGDIMSPDYSEGRDLIFDRPHSDAEANAGTDSDADDSEQGEPS